MRLLNYIRIFKTFTRVIPLRKPPIRWGATRTITGDKITSLTENTLLGRIFLYLNPDKITTKLLIKDIKNDYAIIEDLIHGKTSVLRNLNDDQICRIFYTANANVYGKNKKDLRKLLKILDVECCLRMNSMDRKTVLKVLNAFMHVIPNRITDYKFYQYVITNMDTYLEAISKADLLQFIFYVGLEKKDKRTQIVLRKCLKLINNEMLDGLNMEELCIICNSTYRTKTRLNNTKLLEKVKQKLNDDLSLLKDPTLLVTLLKTIRQNYYQDDDLLTTLSCTIFFNKTAQYYTFPVMCNILSLFATDYYYDEELLNLFYEKCLNELQQCRNVVPKKVHVSEQLRAKDITTFLWSLSTLGYTQVDSKVLEEVIVPVIRQRVQVGEYKNRSEELVNSVLYMWILNCRSYELLSLALDKEHMSRLKEITPRNRYNLNLLLKVIELEDKDLFTKINVQPLNVPHLKIEAHLQNRVLLHKVLQVLRSSKNLNLEKFEANFQVPYLNIAGISGYADKSNRAVNIEVLDDYSCVKNKDCQPNGYMRLKLRILEQSDVPLVTVSHTEIQNMNDTELQQYLEDEIKLFI